MSDAEEFAEMKARLRMNETRLQALIDVLSKEGIIAKADLDDAVDGLKEAKDEAH